MASEHNLSQSNGRQTQSAAANRYFLGETIAILLCPAANGKVFGVTIDRSDLPRVLAVGTWRIANFDSANGRVNLYCYCKSKDRHIYLHRFILDAPKGVEVDHRHHRNFDNRKSQIRLASKSQNQRNRRDNWDKWPQGAEHIAARRAS